MGDILIDETGKVYGRLTVLAKDTDTTRWLCRCSCGKQTLALGPQLRNGNKKSCGCLIKELKARRSRISGRVMLANVGYREDYEI